MTELQKQAALDQLKKLLLKGHTKYQEAAELSKRIFQQIETLQVDPSEEPTDAENAENLEAAICCFLQYGEYDVNRIISEIGDAMPPCKEENPQNPKKTRVFISNTHVAALDEELVLKFRHTCKIDNFTAWVREQAKSDYGIILSDKDSVVELNARVKEDYWPNIGNWLSQKMIRAISGVQEIP